MKLSECSFRDLLLRCVILKGEWVYSGAVEHLEKHSYSIPKDMDAALCLCYIDTEAGLSFHFLCLANYDSGEIDVKSYDKQLEEKTVLIFRSRPDFEVKIYTEDDSMFHFRREIVETCYNSNPEVWNTRLIADIDHMRHESYPDDIRILLRRKGLETEYPWVRLLEFREGKLIGKLLNEPHQDFGIYSGSELELELGKFEDKVYATFDATSLTAIKASD